MIDRQERKANRQWQAQRDRDEGGREKEEGEAELIWEEYTENIIFSTEKKKRELNKQRQETGKE